MIINATIRFALFLGGIITVILPAHAWGHDGGKYWYGAAPGYYGYHNNNYWQRNGWRHNNWRYWRAPWRNDSSRWGRGPWNSFGDSMNDFISGIEGDVELNMKIKGNSRGENRLDYRYRGDGYGSDYRGYTYPYPYRPPKNPWFRRYPPLR